jgi:hypothetical protein
LRGIEEGLRVGHGGLRLAHRAPSISCSSEVAI